MRRKERGRQTLYVIQKRKIEWKGKVKNMKMKKEVGVVKGRKGKGEQELELSGGWYETVSLAAISKQREGHAHEIKETLIQAYASMESTLQFTIVVTTAVHRKDGDGGRVR